MLDEHGQFSRAIKGFEHGQSGTLPANLDKPFDIADSKTPEYAAGRNIGVRSRLVTKAASSESNAVGLANEVNQGGTAAELRGALNSGETNRIQALGLKEAQSAERLNQVYPAVNAPSDETARDVMRGVETVAAAGGHVLTGFKVHVFTKLVTAAQVSPGTAKAIAEMATDPAKIPRVIAALRKARVSNQKIREILMPIAAGAGNAAAEATQ
jgi:hypothetical protein